MLCQIGKYQQVVTNKLIQICTGFSFFIFYSNLKHHHISIHEAMLKKTNTFLTLFQYSILLIFISVLQVSCYDLDNYNAAIDIVIPSFASVILQEVSPGDAPLIFRTQTLLGNAWFDATAPYHPTAIGVYTKFPPQYRFTEVNNRQKNTALLYASYQVLMSLHPRYKSTWDQMMRSAGLEPEIISKAGTPQNLGITAGRGVVKNRENDGMNQLGNTHAKGQPRKYNAIPYWDYTGYQPINTAYKLKDPRYWQPQIVSRNNGLFQVQQFVTPQLGLTTPYSYSNTSIFKVAQPVNSDNVKNWQGYINQAKAVLNASANLNEQRKMKAQFFDHKLRSLLFSTIHIQKKYNLSLLDFIQFFFTIAVAHFDTIIPIWYFKGGFDAVRPITAISFLYQNKTVNAWGGPGKGTVNDIPSNQWKPYLGTGDHSQYPSASASFCAAHAVAARKFLKSDKLQWQVLVKAGDSVKQPKISPVRDFTIYYDTWTKFDEECGQSRFWGGVHFPDSITQGHKIGEKAGNLAFDFVNSLIKGGVKTSSQLSPFSQGVFANIQTPLSPRFNFTTSTIPKAPSFPASFPFSSLPLSLPSSLSSSPSLLMPPYDISASSSWPLSSSSSVPHSYNQFASTSTLPYGNSDYLNSQIQKLLNQIVKARS